MKKILSFMAIAMILMGLSACSGGGASTPKDAVTSAVNAMKSGDIKAVASVCCDSQGKPSKFELPGDAVKAANATLKEAFSGVNYTIAEPVENGNKATVAVTFSKDGDQMEYTFRCIKGEDGKWRVDENSLPDLD